MIYWKMEILGLVFREKVKYKNWRVKKETNLKFRYLGFFSEFLFFYELI